MTIIPGCYIIYKLKSYEMFEMENIMRGTPRKEDLFKLPNILCYIRILLVPLFVYLYIKGFRIQAALVVIGASVTDVIDGRIARHFHLVTDWGKFIDPVADKLMQFAMLVVTLLTIKWVAFLVVLFCIKELIMLVVGVYIYHNGYNLDGAMWCGKVCTVIFDVVMIAFIAFPDINKTVVFIMLGITAAFLVLSFVVYMNEYKKLLVKIAEEKQEEENNER